ncbi:MAG TPA: Crp/Fnr family transcriptional regulator [Allosphingosinicella sp.]|uniref:Crp/Fnr family transcriptional regulator n=1 Tax=Allosphingosinicella sp. TaxID=2823234 RepID=UPI002ED90485
MPQSPRVCADCPVRDQAVCAALDERELAELSSIGQHVNYSRGETIFAAGDDSIACATLISGAAKISAVDAEGTERIVALVHPAGFLGQLFAATAKHDVTALTDTRLCAFPREGFERLMENHPKLTRSILERTLAELDASRALADLIGRRDIKARLAGLLLALARAAAPTPCGMADAFELPLSREEMASLLGTTIESISRRLTELERDGIIERNGARGLTILDQDKLQSAAH